MKELDLEDIAAYRAWLEMDPDEWAVLDELCHITISRFFRDSWIFEALILNVLPEIAIRAAREQREARFWTTGCASGEETYTLKIIWDLKISSNQPGIGCSVIATDVDQAMLDRARQGCYPRGSLRELPENCIAQGFDYVGNLYCVRPKHREGVCILQQDLRSEAPEGLFDLILCRNVAFTYFESRLQCEALSRLVEHLSAPGYLVIGADERLPQDIDGLVPVSGVPEILKYTPEADLTR